MALPLQFFLYSQYLHPLGPLCKITVLGLGKGPLKKNRKKLTNVSLVCMYVGRKSEMLVFFCFFPTVVIFQLFQWSNGKKTEKC